MTEMLFSPQFGDLLLRWVLCLLQCFSYRDVHTRTWRTIVFMKYFIFQGSARAPSGSTSRRRLGGGGWNAHLQGGELVPLLIWCTEVYICRFKRIKHLQGGQGGW